MYIEEKTLNTLEFNKVRDIVVTYARSQQSQNLCQKLTVASDLNEVQRQLSFTKEAKAILDKAIDIPIEHIANIEELTQNANSYLSEEELIEVANTMKAARLVKNFIKENSEESSLLASLANPIFTDKNFEDSIFSKIDENYNVKMDASETLTKLFEDLKGAEKDLKSKISELLSTPNFTKHLQETIYTIRDNRVVFPVMASSKGQVSGITHDVSATNKTTYIEPSQIVPMNNRIREVKSKINHEIVKILSALTKTIKNIAPQLKQDENLLAQIDFHFAKARYACAIRAVEPELIENKGLKFVAMRHPLLIGNVDNIVANDIELGKDYKSIIITGSNTGGKTVTLKTIGLFTLMTKAGLFLPCHEAKIFPFNKILADIGDEQDIVQNLSTFSSHMKNIIEILNVSDENSLVLLDEICAGTEPQEGVVLAETILENLANKNVLSVITTHFADLKALEYTNPFFKNACVEFDKETLKPTYKLFVGIPGASNAIFISANLGLPKELVDRACDILNVHRDPSAVLIEKLQETQQKMAKNLREVEEFKNESLKLKEMYEDKLNELQRNKKKTIKSIENKFSNELDSVKLEIKTVLNDLRKNKSEKLARRSYTRLAQLEQDFRSELNEVDISQSYNELDWSKVQVGSDVIIKELNQKVKVLSLPDKNGYLMVQMGMIKTKIAKSQVAQFDSNLVKKPQLRLQPVQSFELKKNNMSNTLDLRGYTVEDALDCLEAYLDQASLANLSPVYIIHGHGTGILKSYVRDYISTSPYVSKYRPGEPPEGGDGVSVVDIK